MDNRADLPFLPKVALALVLMDRSECPDPIVSDNAEVIETIPWQPVGSIVHYP